MAHPVIRYLIMCLMVSVVALGCNSHESAKKSAMLAPPKTVLSRNVDVTPVLQKPLVYRVETVGLLEAEGQTDIAAGVTGIVDSVSFREGDVVEAGQVLITIDQDRFKADFELAKANNERAKAGADLAHDIWDRTERAGRGVSEEERVKARGGLNVAEAEYRSSSASLARAKVMLERSRVRAPYEGRINKRNITKGSYLEEKTTIATIADLSKIRLVGYVPESAAPIVRELFATQDDRQRAHRLAYSLNVLHAWADPFRPVTTLLMLASDQIPTGSDPEFQVLALPGQEYRARIFYLSTVANAETHMFECKAEVLGWKHSPSSAKHGSMLTNLWPGFTAKIAFPLRSNASALVIPEEAVRNTERGHVVFVPMRVQRSDGKTEYVARTRTVELGYRGEGFVEVRQGLEMGERIIHRGAEAVEDGAPIRFKEGA